MTLWNFTFGSHLSSSRFSEVIGATPLAIQPAKLLGYRLTFAKLLQYPDDCAHLATGGGPQLVKHAHSEICSVAYQISNSQFEIVDSYEQAWGYQPFAVTVHTTSGPLKAMAHNLVHAGAFEAPARPFLDLMIEGLREHGYCPQQVEDVVRAATQTTA